MKLYTYEYFWKTSDSEKINFRIITDLLESHEKFVESIKSLDSLISFCREYVSEIDMSKLSGIEILHDNKEVKNEKN